MPAPERTNGRDLQITQHHDKHAHGVRIRTRTAEKNPSYDIIAFVLRI